MSFRDRRRDHDGRSVPPFLAIDLVKADAPGNELIMPSLQVPPAFGLQLAVFDGVDDLSGGC